MQFEDAFRLACAESHGSLALAPTAPSPAVSTPGTVAEVVTAAMEVLSGRVQKSTIRAMRQHAKMFTQLWGSRKASALTAQDFHEFIQARRLTHSNSTVRHELALMSNIFGVALESGWVALNPLHRLKKLRLQINRRTQWLREEDEHKLEAGYLAFSSWANPEQGLGAARARLEWSAVRFAILTGCRRGEMLALKADSLDRETLNLPAGKTGPRSVPLHPLAREIAESWLSLEGRGSSRFIFWPWSPSQGLYERQRWAERMPYAKQFRPICNSVGLRELRWHDLRRTFACRLLARGVGVFEVMKLLGHSNPTQTMTYCQVGFDLLAASVARLV